MPDQRNEPSKSDGVAGQMSRLKHHSGATASELREFIHTMKGKNPQQMLGMIAQSDLVRSTAIATVMFAVLLMIFTIGPAIMSGDSNKADAASPAEKQQNDEKQAKAKAKNTKAKVASKDANTKGKQPTAVIPGKGKDGDILNALDIGGTKKADPTKNPLDGFNPFEGVKE